MLEYYTIYISFKISHMNTNFYFLEQNYGIFKAKFAYKKRSENKNINILTRVYQQPYGSSCYKHKRCVNYCYDYFFPLVNSYVTLSSFPFICYSQVFVLLQYHSHFFSKISTSKKHLIQEYKTRVSVIFFESLLQNELLFSVIIYAERLRNRARIEQLTKNEAFGNTNKEVESVTLIYQNLELIYSCARIMAIRCKKRHFYQDYIYLAHQIIHKAGRKQIYSASLRIQIM